MRWERENLVGQRSGQRDRESEESKGDQHIADQTRMPAGVEFVHTAMTPSGPHFRKEKLLPCH